MWQAILKAAVKIAVWAAQHPDEIKQIVDSIQDGKDKK